MAPPHKTDFDLQIERLVKDGLNARQIYMFLNLNARSNGLSDIISYATVYRRYKVFERKYKPWIASLLPHEELFRTKKK